jgi:hypothetical protein
VSFRASRDPTEARLVSDASRSEPDAAPRGRRLHRQRCLRSRAPDPQGHGLERAPAQERSSSMPAACGSLPPSPTARPSPRRRSATRSTPMSATSTAQRPGDERGASRASSSGSTPASTTSSAPTAMPMRLPVPT